MYAIRSYYDHPAVFHHRQNCSAARMPDNLEGGAPAVGKLVLLDQQRDDTAAKNDVITSYSIHYTKLYDSLTLDGKGVAVQIDGDYYGRLPLGVRAVPGELVMMFPAESRSE